MARSLSPEAIAMALTGSDRADLVTCEAVLERLTSALAARNPRTG